MKTVPVKDKNYWFDYSNGVDLEDDAIQEMVDDVIKRLTEEKDGAFAFSSTGNTFVIAMAIDDEITVIVSKNYKEATLVKTSWAPLEIGAFDND